MRACAGFSSITSTSRIARGSFPALATFFARRRTRARSAAFLSGAGSTLMAITLDRVVDISAAMVEAARRHDLPGQVRVLKADNDGVRVLPD